MRKTFAWLALIMGIVFAVLTVVYWITPANALPMYLPGYDPTLAAVHFKHGLAALIIALAFLAYAWFTSVPKRS